jgi:hypothetical protein
MCAKCNVGLCVHPCFEKYHTLLNFWRFIVESVNIVMNLQLTAFTVLCA